MCRICLSILDSTNKHLKINTRSQKKLKLHFFLNCFLVRKRLFFLIMFRKASVTITHCKCTIPERGGNIHAQMPLQIFTSSVLAPCKAALAAPVCLPAFDRSNNGPVWSEEALLYNQSVGCDPLSSACFCSSSCW